MRFISVYETWVLSARCRDRSAWRIWKVFLIDSVRFDRLNRRRFESGDRENVGNYMETTLQVKQVRNTYFQWATKGKVSCHKAGNTLMKQRSLFLRKRRLIKLWGGIDHFLSENRLLFWAINIKKRSQSVVIARWQNGLFAWNKDVTRPKKYIH